MPDQYLRSELTDGVLRLTIDRPEKRNPLSRQLLAALRAELSERCNDESIRFAILTGAGDASFAAGGDLQDLQKVVGAAAAAQMARDSKAALSAVREFPAPVVAALNGDALGGGAELAVACDLRFFAAHAQIGFIQGRLAISTAWGGGTDLIRLVGPASALRLMARSELVDAKRALAIGLADGVADDDSGFEEELQHFVAPMRAQSPHVLRAFKALSLHERRRGREEGDDIETRHFATAWAHPDHDEAVERILNRRKSK